MKPKSFSWWLKFCLLFLWQLPQNIIALCMIPFLGKLTLRCERNYCFCYIGEKMQGGISLGNFAFVSKTLGKRDAEVAHEVNGHTFDSKWMGPLYLILIGLPSILNAIFGFTDCYHDFYAEKHADKHAHLNVRKYKYNGKTYGILSFNDGYKL